MIYSVYDITRARDCGPADGHMGDFEAAYAEYALVAALEDTDLVVGDIQIVDHDDPMADYIVFDCIIAPSQLLDALATIAYWRLRNDTSEFDW